MNNKGNYEKFKRSLKEVIDSFERAKEWADLSNCLQKVKKQFDQNQNTEIPMKKDLAKRLAQCLNPDLAVIHQLTLEVYGMIFQRQIELLKQKANEGPNKQDLEWGSDLGLFYSGLFNFFQFAAFEVKDPFLQIIETYILQLDKELLLSLPGFMICMLPALEDQNAQILKRVENILAKTEEAVGTSEFYGEIWKAMLRTQRTRVSAIKYLDKRIPKDLEQARLMAKQQLIYPSKYTVKVIDQKVTLVRDDAQRLSDESKRLERMTLEDYFYFYYPVKEKLCINSLLAGLADQSVYVNRGVLDFLISHAPITGNINTLSENVRLVEGALMTLTKKDFAFLKKFFTWTLSHLEDEESKPSEDDPAIRTLVPALQCMFLKFTDAKSVSLSHMQQHSSGQGGQNSNQLNHNQPILILQTLLNDNVMIVEPILVKISVDLIKFIKLYYSENQNKTATKQLDRFIDNVNNLFDMVNNQLHSIWMALGQLLSEQIRSISVEYAQDAYLLEAIELIDFCLRDLKLGFERQVENFSEQLRPILSRLLSGVSKLSNYMNNLENAIPGLELIESILIMLDNKPVTREDTENLKTSVDNFNEFYVNLCKVMTNFDEPDYQDMFKLRFDTFKKSSQILNQIQKYSYTFDLNNMPAWLTMVIHCSKAKRAKIVLVSIETFLNILSKQASGPDDQIKKLQNIIVRFEPGLKVDDSRSIYQTLQESNNPYCTDIIKTLWSLLDEEEDHQKIVQLLKKFDGLLPRLFSEVVIEELNSKDREIKVRAIKKFTIFWKLTATDYPQYKPFYDKNTDLRKQVALHNMLHILEDNDPTLRLSCKSWLSESKKYYRRILDPLIEEFLQNSKIFITYSGQIFFYKDYEANIVIENFGKLRNIILNTQEEMIYYITTRQYTDYIGKEFLEMFSWMRPRRPNLKCQRLYLQVIVYITLQFIMAQAVESVNEKPYLYQESQTVNASACEFMELILKSLEQNKEMSNEIAHIIIDPIIRTFRQVIDNQNHAMQVHLLNLLKVIFFQCNFDSPESQKDQFTQTECSRIFSDASFIDSIVKGMKNEVSFVRYHFIQFATTIVPFMLKLINPQVFNSHIKKFVDCFCGLLRNVDPSLFITQQQFLGTAALGIGGYAGDNVDKAIRLTSTNMRLKTSVAVKQQTLINHNIQGGAAKPKDQLVINQESDISQIIQGLEQIVYYCLGIVRDLQAKPQASSQTSGILMDDRDNSENQKEKELTFGERLLGYFGTGPFKKGAEFTVTNENTAIREPIYKEFQNIIVSCLYCWNNLPIFTAKDYLFSRSGIFPYNMEDEKLLSSSIEKSEQKETLQNYINSKANLIHKFVIDFLRPLAQTSSPYFIEGILFVWMDKKNLTGMNLNQSLEKMMQILISVRLSTHVVIEAINLFVQKNDLATKKPSSKKIVKLQKIDSQRESMICQFLYTYLLYNINQQFKDEQNQLAKIYAAVFKFIKQFQQTKHPLTICWLLEILHILSNKFTASDAYKQETKLKRDFQEMLTLLLTSTASILSDTFKIEFEQSYGFKIVFSPTVYELLRRFSFVLEQNNVNVNSSMAVRNEYKKKFANPNYHPDSDDEEQEETKGDAGLRQFGFNNKVRMTIGSNQNPVNVDHLFDPDYQNHNYYYDERDNISQLMIDLSQYINKGESDCPSFLLLHYYKFFTIITLKSILYHMVQSICLHSNHDKITAALSIVVNVVLQILSNKTDKDKLDKQQVVIREAITDFFATIMDRANQLLVKPYKREISELFYSDNFFQMSRRTLRKWCKIINHFILDQKDQVFEDLVYKWNTQAGLLTSKDFEIKQKCIALKRVAFLVFSGDQDQYDDKLDLLLKKMTEGFKTNKKYSELRIQLFLLTRVLLLRLHSNSLADALRKLWPHLLNELVSIFEDAQSDCALTFEAIKTIELMSSLNIEDFQMNQWIFLVDSYGMAFDDSRSLVDEYRHRHDSAQISKKAGDYEVIERSEGIFQPFIVKFMQNRKTSFYNQINNDKVTVEDLLNGKKNQIEMRKTSINISPENYSDDALETYAIGLQYRLNEFNMERTEIDRPNFEALIEKDFIQNDQK
ncbi:n-terminal domain-containing protein [Stylonychia lemnae]|uniref:N-terminal domain-containing protein n=1 Tax=Stylonychia lemnae TaxID=5949 RepID=A0A078ATP8_STYLE|nr:n-terminal domain-containing protein [Stylonychia lemnae]|eukprot:CDW85800.1 n-terminal domain-containing protein [Stylonychia lemnae]